MTVEKNKKMDLGSVPFQNIEKDKLDAPVRTE